MTLPITLGPYVVGERPDPIAHTFLDDDGAVIDLTGYTASARLLAPGAIEGVDVPDVTVPIPANGTVVVDLAELIDQPKTWRLEVWVDQAAGRRYASRRFRFFAAAALPTPA